MGPEPYPQPMDSSSSAHRLPPRAAALSAAGASLSVAACCASISWRSWQAMRRSAIFRNSAIQTCMEAAQRLQMSMLFYRTCSQPTTSPLFLVGSEIPPELRDWRARARGATARGRRRKSTREEVLQYHGTVPRYSSREEEMPMALETRQIIIVLLDLFLKRLERITILLKFSCLELVRKQVSLFFQLQCINNMDILAGMHGSCATPSDEHAVLQDMQPTDDISL